MTVPPLPHDHDHDHDALRDDLAGYALGALSTAEASHVEAHLAGCSECQAILAEYAIVLNLLPHGLPISQPSPESRRALLERAHEVSQAQTPARTPRVVPLRVVAAVAACLLVIFAATSAAFLAWGSGRSDRNDAQDDPAMLLAQLRQRPGVQMLAMVGSEAAPAAVGQIVVDPGDTRAALLVSGLPPLTQEQVYQFWFVQPDEQRISGAIFTVDTNGAAIVEIKAPEEFSRDWRCGVTEEPAGGSSEPTGRNVLAASYDAPPGMYPGR